MVNSIGPANLEIVRGDTKTFTVTYTETDGTPVDLTDYTARMQIRKTMDDGSYIWQGSTTTGEISITGASGLISITIPKTNTATFNFDRGKYDLEITSSTGVTETIMGGEATLIKDVTR